MRSLVLMLVVLGACTTVPITPATPQLESGGGSAVVNTAVAVTAAVISRSGGGCVATCTGGTICNEAKGVCELPCDGQCRAGELCDAARNLCLPMDIRTTTVAPTRP